MQYVVYDYSENGNSIAYDAHVYTSEKKAEDCRMLFDTRHTRIEKFENDELVKATCSVVYH